MNIKALGVTNDMLKGIANGSFILEGGYKTLTQDEILSILKKCMVCVRKLHNIDVKES